MRKLLFVFAVAVLAVSHFASAQDVGHVRYKWQDAQGLMHFSDSLSADAMKFGYTLINDQGVVIGRVARQLTPDERVAADKAAEQEAAQQRAAKDLANSEAQMLNAYPDEATFRLSQKQALGAIDQQIRTTMVNLRTQEKALADLLDSAADLERAKEPVTASLTKSIAEQRDVVTGQRNTLVRQQAGRTKALQAQGAQLVRYRELRAAQEKRDQP